MSSVISSQDSEFVCSWLNELAPDTFDEGEFGEWTFQSIKINDGEWVVEFHNSEGDDSVSFTHSGGAVVEGVVESSWMDRLNQAILQWECEMRGDEPEE